MFKPKKYIFEEPKSVGQNIKLISSIAATRNVQIT